MFLNWYPFKSHFFKQVFYLTCWVIGILIYEAVALLPEPWGYFHYNWWNLRYSAIIDPILFMTLFGYFNGFVSWKINNGTTRTSNASCAYTIEKLPIAPVSKVSKTTIKLCHQEVQY